MYHAKLSPSSAGRWIHCPASVLLCKDIPETTSQYAEAGRLAHELAELKARKHFLNDLSAQKFSSGLKKLRASPHYAVEMEGATDTYLDTLKEIYMSFASKPLVALETAVPVGMLTGETKEDGTPATGTADCIMLGDGLLHVIDYKNGRGVPVSAEENPQMAIYALGALQLYQPFFGDSIQTVRMTIVQPAIGNISTWETTRDALLDWGADVVLPAAEEARSGDCEPCPGEWCKSHFCPIRDTCRARAYDYLALEAFGNALPPALANAEVGDVLLRAKGLVAWVKELEDYALQAVLTGEEVPGWKAVEGRSVRAFSDQDEALAILESNGYPRELIYDYVPKSLSQLEKLLGKKAFTELLGVQIVKPLGKPALVEASDRREPYNAAAIAFGEAAV